MCLISYPLFHLKHIGEMLLLSGCRTHICNALEQDRLVAWALREAERAHRFGALVLICHQEIVQTGVANILHEPFTSSICFMLVSILYVYNRTRGKGDEGEAARAEAHM